MNNFLIALQKMLLALVIKATGEIRPIKTKIVAYPLRILTIGQYIDLPANDRVELFVTMFDADGSSWLMSIIDLDNNAPIMTVGALGQNPVTRVIQCNNRIRIKCLTAAEVLVYGRIQPPGAAIPIEIAETFADDKANDAKQIPPFTLRK